MKAPKIAVRRRSDFSAPTVWRDLPLFGIVGHSIAPHIGISVLKLCAPYGAMHRQAVPKLRSRR